MVYPDSKKRVILLDDAHAQYLKSQANRSELALMADLYTQQKETLTQLTYSLLYLDPKIGAQTVVITECADSAFGCIAEQEMGADVVRENGEMGEVMPRIFLQHIFASGSTVDEKLAIFQKAIQPFNGIQTASFMMKNQVRWIAADRFRKEKDRYLSFEIYLHYQDIKKSLEAHEELPAEFKELTIGNVSDYLKTMDEQCKECNITQNYYTKIVEVITAVLATNKLKESDHFALLHDYLMTSGQSQVRDELNNNVLCFIAHKFDIELQHYINAFTQDSELSCLIVQAGGVHNEYVRTLLSSKGYVMTAKTGSDVLASSRGEDLLRDGKIAEFLNIVKDNPAVTDIRELGFTKAPFIPKLAVKKSVCPSLTWRYALWGAGVGVVALVASMWGYV